MKGDDGEMQFAKIVLLGATMVGKTTLVSRLTAGEFDDNIKPTVGACYSCRVTDVGATRIKLQIWDTAGQERFKTVVPMYFRGAAAALIVYSVVDANSFRDVDFWATRLKERSDRPPALFLIGNKIDLPEREVSTAAGQDAAKAHGAEFYEVSAASGIGLEEMIQRVAEVAVARADEKSAPIDASTTVVVIKDHPKRKTTRRFC
jgi:small GTP-binding protein